MSATFNHQLNKQSPMPLYHQLKELILLEVEDGNWHADEMIPTEFEIMDYFDVSRTTVRQALNDLVKDNVLYRKKGVGTFVAKPKIDLRYMGDVVSYNSQIQSAGLTPYTKVVSLEVISLDAADVLRELGLQKGDMAIRLLRVRYAEDEPIAVVESYLPHALCYYIMNVDFEHESLYQTLAAQPQTRVIHVERVVEAQLASKVDRELMQLAKGFPVQTFYSKAFNAAGQVVEYSIARYRGDRNKFYVSIDVET